ncbi:MAG: hypothetical protein ACE5I1_14640 [bacterium]
MHCPHCHFEGHRMDLHAHLLEAHAEEVLVYMDESSSKLVYEMTCPICKDSVKQPLRKRAAQLDAYKREIRMVAFDLLLYHLAEKHADTNEI